MKKLQIIKLLNTFFNKKREVIVTYLFGSYARGNQNKLSDIDLAVLVDKNNIKQEIFKYRIELISDLISLLKMNKLDVIILNDAPPLLAHRIVQDGIIINNKDNYKKIKYEVTALKKYIDTKPIRKIQKKYFKQRISA